MVDDQEVVQTNGDIVKENDTAKRNQISKKYSFTARNSFLTDLFKEKQNRTAYYTFIALSLGLCFNAVVESLFIQHSSIFGLRLIRQGMKNAHKAAALWALIFATVLLSFKCYNIWAETRVRLKGQYWYLWDRLWIFTLVLYYIAILYVTFRSVFTLDLPFLTAVALESEIVRLLLKVHSFVRNSAPEVLNHTKGPNVGKQFNRFLYFLFAPTLIYRDEYPRTRRIRWNFVVTCFLELALLAVTLAVVLDMFVLQYFNTVVTKESLRKNLIAYALRFNFAGAFVMIYLFYMTLHAFQNLFAELTRFADREFYRDWWCSTSLSQYLKTWNILVYSWLFMYIYKDIYENVWRNKTVAKVMVVLLSAVMHEIMLACSMRMFFPFLFFVFFTSGMLTTWLKVEEGDVSHIVSMFLFFWGSGLILSAYAIEYCARYYLPASGNDVSDFFVPRSLALFTG